MNWHSLELSSFTHQAASHLRHQWVWPVSAGPTSASFSHPRSDTTQPPRAQRLDGHMVGHPPHPGCAPQLLSLPAFPHADHPQPPAGPLMLSDALSAQPRLCQPAGGTPDTWEVGTPATLQPGKCLQLSASASSSVKRDTVARSSLLLPKQLPIPGPRFPWPTGHDRLPKSTGKAKGWNVFSTLGVAFIKLPSDTAQFLLQPELRYCISRKVNALR